MKEKSLTSELALFLMWAWAIYGTLYWYDWKLLLLLVAFVWIHNFDRHYGQREEEDGNSEE